jgi:hypothetical protein
MKWKKWIRWGKRGGWFYTHDSNSGKSIHVHILIKKFWRKEKKNSVLRS